MIQSNSITQGMLDETAYNLLKENEFTVIIDLCMKVARSVMK